MVWWGFMDFEGFVDLLLEGRDDLFELLRDARDERDVIVALASVVGCGMEVRFRLRFFDLVVDLLCGDLAVEVEFNRLPHEGVHQVLAYRIFLGFDSALIHVLDYCTDDYVSSFKELLKELNHLSIRGAIIDIASGEIIVV